MIALYRRYFQVSSYLLVVVCTLFLVCPVAAGDQDYTVQPGDNLYRIALRHGLTTQELAAANGITNPHRLYTGQVLTIPETTSEMITEQQGAGEGVDSVAPENARWQAFSRLVDSMVAVQQTVAEVQNRHETLAQPSREHIVRPGETLARIGQQYATATATLARANQLSSPYVIYPGQRLRVPGNAFAGTAAAAIAPAGAHKQIVVDKSEQRAYVYEGGELLWQFIISTGMPGMETWEGTFQIRSKIPNAYAYNWGLQMPYWLGFYHTGYLENGFHALPIMSSGAILWDGYLGTPVSYGCVILSYPDAEALYGWAEIGTEVIVQP